MTAGYPLLNKDASSFFFNDWRVTLKFRQFIRQFCRNHGIAGFLDEQALEFGAAVIVSKDCRNSFGLKKSHERVRFNGENHWIYNGYDHDMLYPKRGDVLEGTIHSSIVLPRFIP